MTAPVPMGDNNDSALIASCAVQITSQHLPLVRGELVLLALQTIEILYVQFQGLVAFKSLINVFVIHVYGEDPPSAYQQGKDAQDND